MFPGSQIQKQAAGLRRQAWYFALLVVDAMVITPSITIYSITADTGF